MRPSPGPRVSEISRERRSASPSTRRAFPPVRAPRSASLQPRSASAASRRGIAADVLEADGQHVDPVVVAAEADVLGAGDLAHVLAVRHDVVDARPRCRVAAPPLVDEGVVCRVVVQVDPRHLRGVAGLEVPLAHRR